MTSHLALAAAELVTALALLATQAQAKTPIIGDPTVVGEASGLEGARTLALVLALDLALARALVHDHVLVPRPVIGMRAVIVDETSAPPTTQASLAVV